MSKKMWSPMRWGFWTEVASAAAGGIGAALVSEIGSGVREYLADRRALAAEREEETVRAVMEEGGGGGEGAPN